MTGITNRLMPRVDERVTEARGQVARDPGHDGHGDEERDPLVPEHRHEGENAELDERRDALDAAEPVARRGELERDHRRSGHDRADERGNEPFGLDVEHVAA